MDSPRRDMYFKADSRGGHRGFREVDVRELQGRKGRGQGGEDQEERTVSPPDHTEWVMMKRHSKWRLSPKEGVWGGRVEAAKF